MLNIPFAEYLLLYHPREIHDHTVRVRKETGDTGTTLSFFKQARN
jgi:hypothetical protein